MTDIRPPGPCRLYAPGHAPHWIQARKSREDHGELPLAARLIEVTAEGFVTIDVDGHELHLWNHDPLRLAEAAGLAGGRVRYHPRWHLLYASGYLFCVAVPPDDHVPCQAPFPQ